MIETFDLLLRDLMETETIVGGKVVIFGGDFRQSLPVVRSEKGKIIFVKVYCVLKFGINLKNYNYRRICVQIKILNFVNI